MVDTRKKGNTTVRRAIAYYKSQGYLAKDVEKKGRYVKDKDLFGLFDLVVVGVGFTIYVQVKTNRPATRGPLAAWARQWKHHCHCITWYDRKGFVIQHYCSDGTIYKEDLRKK